MPAKRRALLAAIVVFFCSVVLFSYFYGPTRRTFASRTTVLSVQSTEQVLQAWETSELKGRIAICFTRYLNALETKESQATKATELAMNHGIIRKVYHVPPDSAWGEIQGSLSKRNDMRQTPGGFIGIFDDGRVYITPLSQFTSVPEPALILVEPKIWSGDELLQIAELLSSGRLVSDLVIVVRGGDRDAELFRRALGLQ